MQTRFKREKKSQAVLKGFLSRNEDFGAGNI